MKQPRTFLLLAVIVATLLLGVAYAAINNINLQINGTATATPDQANFDVGFMGTPTTGGVGTTTVNIVGETSAKISVTGLTAAGDKATATFTIKNGSPDLYANLTKSITNTNTEYFTVTGVLGKTVLSPAGDTTTFTITVVLNKTPVSENPKTDILATVTSSPSNDDYECYHPDENINYTCVAIDETSHKTTRYCDNCGETLAEYTAEHNFDFNGVCAGCGYSNYY